MIQKLSVVIITFNEEVNIGKCIDAASQVADEIVVVDSYSTDNTRSICESKGARFIENEFKGYGRQKNFASSLASFDYVLSLDADEVLSPELVKSILNVKANPTHRAYYVNRKSYYVDRFINHGHWFPDRKIRLYHKGYGHWTLSDVHEVYKPATGHPAKRLHGVLFHYTFKSVQEHVNQANKFSEIGANQLITRSKAYLIFKAISSPLWGFIYGYFLKLGFLDGWYGLSISLISSIESYLKYSKARILQKKLSRSGLSVMHLSSIKKWRGGEQQVAYLVEQLRANGVYNHLVVAKHSELSNYCKKNGIAHTTIRYTNGWNLFAAWKIKGLANRLKMDVIHMHCSPSHTLAIFSNLFGCNSKLVLSRRVIFPVRSNRLSVKKFNYPAIERIICVSKAIQTVLEKSISRTGIFSVVYDGIDLDSITQRRSSISIRDEFNLHNKTIVTIIAALSPEKDHITFIEAAQILANSSDKFHFLIVGTGVEEKRIVNFIHKSGLSEKITMTGFRSDIPDILMDSNYFVLTSIQEGLGSSILEAFANKLPVVATSIGGIPELVINEKTGLLVNIHEPQGIADQIMKLEQDVILQENIIAGAYEHLNANFLIKTTAANTEKIYRELMFD